ncbi:MAG: accessory factor UbiK family protein [Pseudomonadaceae bacterium]|nr:accessory factor UbiK family protein [Pseudomonadaceae bacterium]
MLRPEHLQRITEEITAKLGDFNQPLPTSQTLKNLVNEVATRLDLVSREDYERLLQIHQRTRQKVDQLSGRLEALEAKLKN